MMLKLQPLLFDEETILDKEIFIPNGENKEEEIEFLYVRGDGDGWTYGITGRMNGAIIESSAREFFRKYF